MILLSKDGKDLIVTCDCGCNDTVHISVDKIDEDTGKFAYSTYLNGNRQRDRRGALAIIIMKCEKIWRILRNKDHHYSEILMTEQDFATFRDYVNDVWEKTHGET